MILLFIFLFILNIPLWFVVLQLTLSIYKIKYESKSVNVDTKISDEYSIGIIIPAHNEELVIDKLLNSLFFQINKKTTVVVVADNCTDSTKYVAEQFGAIVLERMDEVKKGKGYALDFAMQYFKNSPKDVIIMLDADCVVERNCISKLVQTAIEMKSPVQACYLMKSLSSSTSIPEFTWKIKNFFRPLGMKVMKGPCQLMGSGMAFPWDIIKDADLANANLVEDMKLGVDFTLKNNSPLFCPDAKVISFFPTNDSVIKSQRTRWEHGHLSTIFQFLPKLLSSYIKTLNIKTLLFTLDLSVPPLILLLFINILTFLIYGIIYFILFNEYSLFFMWVNFFSLSLFLLSVFVLYKIDGSSKSNITSIIKFFLCKIPLYISFVFHKQIDWVKSKRDSK
jgi:cellulose synthase/poly-beta-1,6-N-acetylglucosamine synthase-like glycosyltransferase